MPLLMLLYVLLLRYKTYPYFKNPGIKTGLLSILAVYPCLILWSTAVKFLVERVSGVVHQDQTVVELVKNAPFGTPAFWTLFFVVTIVAPVVEELLFRGFLQNWLRRYLSMPFAIAITSLLFAFMHYLPEQGYSNITIVSSLFLFSCVLGWLMWRTGGLRAPMALHSLFNLSTVLFILMRGEG